MVFVRHALPGERAVVEITEGTERDRFWRGNAVEILEPSAARVSAPCEYAGPGGCGGCDLQHVSRSGQLDWKTMVVREQLVRLAGMSADDPLVTGLTVQTVGPDDGLRWRSRTRFVHLGQGRLGLRAYRSHQVVEVDDCLITAEPMVGAGREVETVTAAGRTHEFTRALDGFWQPHVEAPRVLVEAVVEMLGPKLGESVLDLYGGVGLFARFLGDEVGPDARVVLIEGDRIAAGHARGNLARGAAGSTSVAAGDVEQVLGQRYDEPFDIVVLDPPRTGAKRAVVEQVVDRAPRAVAYVACDPAALARDLKSFAELGYVTREIRAYDLFPMTHHVECIALLTR